MSTKRILQRILSKKNLTSLILLFILIFTISTITTSKGDDTSLLKKPIGKIPPNGNPLISHKFGADPAVLVYKDRVYIYLTNDIVEYDKNGNVLENSYSKINKITVISSEDLVNWTDHGEIEVAGPNGIAKWAQNSWAPAVAYKKIDGKDKFFLYFANNANGIGVLTADTPLGPWTDPLGRSLINWATPGVAGVVWLFDPAVLVDDDGRAYIYFGGGVMPGREEDPNTARVMELGSDMISVVGTAVPIPAPYMFEDSGINKINNIYYYSYCTNFGPRKPGGLPLGAIAYMTSKNPMGPWEYKGIILKNPGNFFGVGGNNHHQLFDFKGKWYIAYHAQTLARALGIAKGYRSPHINEVQIENGVIKEVFADYKGVPQVKNFDPYRIVEAETYAWCAGISTKKANASNNICLTDIDNGDWIALSKVDFGNNPPKKFKAAIANIKGKGYIEIRIDSIDGKKIGTLEIKPQGNNSSWIEIETSVDEVKGVHDLYFIFRGEGESLFDFDYWQFIK
ncbi:glycoside hydrolase family 43 protein [Dictyoglomus thermophilum]|uniref:Endo-1,4-beta-xylanase D n=1 Tax=Dictyoglomus thermophilum (strain ATCC 35947 / DSM 3960 / H-6-12) TaxID=309799 RepID=B5YB77_DICT6|nr:glycoside hydrolase family 43 protein [Dictyoglomus thermophilum]ACI19652.1 endo-1,4-beta-xylanase D [Dictyoglomus thermophilum H-6-12]